MKIFHFVSLTISPLSILLSSDVLSDMAIVSVVSDIIPYDLTRRGDMEKLGAIQNIILLYPIGFLLVLLYDVEQ